MNDEHFLGRHFSWTEDILWMSVCWKRFMLQFYWRRLSSYFISIWLHLMAWAATFFIISSRESCCDILLSGSDGDNLRRNVQNEKIVDDIWTWTLSVAIPRAWQTAGSPEDGAGRRVCLSESPGPAPTESQTGSSLSSWPELCVSQPEQQPAGGPALPTERNWWNNKTESNSFYITSIWCITTQNLKTLDMIVEMLQPTAYDARDATA